MGDPLKVTVGCGIRTLLLALPFVAACGDPDEVAIDGGAIDAGVDAQQADAGRPFCEGDVVGSDFWSVRIGSAATNWLGDGVGNGLAVDEAGNVTMGPFAVPADLPTDGECWASLVNYNRQGELRWSRQFGSSGCFGSALDVAAGPAGTLAVVGVYDRGVDLGGPERARCQSFEQVFGCMFVVEYWTDGSYVREWVEQFSFGLRVVVDRAGNVVTLSMFNPSSVLFPADSEWVLTQYRGGAPVWSHRFADEGLRLPRPIPIAVDQEDNVLVAGPFSGSINLGGGTLTPVGGADVFVAKYSTEGGYQWSERLGGAGDELVEALAVDRDGSFIIAGGFSGTADLGGDPLTSAGQQDVFVAKYTADGAHIWSRRFGGAGDDVAYGVAIASDGTVVITGGFEGVADFGGEPLVSTKDSQDVVLFAVGRDGDDRWSRRFGGSDSDAGTEVALDGEDNIILSGMFAGTVDFGYGPLTSLSSDDIFIAKLPPEPLDEP